MPEQPDVGALSRRTVVALALAAAAAPLATAPGRAQQTIAGTVVRLRGQASATWSGLTRSLVVGANVLVGDEIRTGAATRLEIRLGQGTTLTLGDDSTLLVEEAETADRGGVVTVLAGVFLGATRALADLTRDSLTVRTPTAVLGVRGTVVWGQQQPGRLAACMLSGTFVTVTTPTYAAVLTAAHDGTDVIEGQPPTPPKRWSDERMAAARATVAFD